MNKFILALFTMIHLGAAQLVFAEKAAPSAPVQSVASIDMENPPFWLFSFEEFSDLQEEQKSFYITNLHSKLSKVPSLKQKTKVQLSDALQTENSWDQIRRKVYEFCQKKSALKTCEGLADVRLQALDIRSVKPTK